MYDAENGVFYSQQIGSFYSFEKRTEDGETFLVGTARIAKRNKKVIDAITYLFAEGRLNFSFEILAGKTTRESNVEIIMSDEKNVLISMAVVTSPADAKAKAYALVANKEDEKHIDKMFANTQNTFVSEVTLNTLYMWTYDALRSIFGEDAWNINVEKFCPDCVIFYHELEAATYKLEYVVQDNRLVITDIYKVKYVREGSEEELKDKQKETMAEEQVEVEATETVEEEKVEQAEEAVEETEVSEAETSEEEAQEEEKEEEVETASTNEEIEIDTLRSRIKTLEEELDMKNKLIASYQLAESQKKAQRVAERGGLDLEDASVKEAVEAGNLMRVAELVAEVAEEVEEEPSGEEKQNPFVADMKIEGGNKDYSYMFKPAQK